MYLFLLVFAVVAALRLQDTGLATASIAVAAVQLAAGVYSIGRRVVTRYEASFVAIGQVVWGLTAIMGFVFFILSFII